MERSSFFNAELVGEIYDRTYTAEDFARYFASFIGNGVYVNSASNLQVIGSGESMTIRINPGKAWINGYFYENTEDLLLNVDVADGTLSRIDRIVVRLDYVGRIITIIIKKGNLSSSPVAPTLQRDVNVYEIALADVRVNAGIISINQSAITDLRHNKFLCGLVSGVVDQIDTTNLFAQFQTTFDTFYEEMKGQLGEDAAGNLQLQINDFKAKQGDTNREFQIGIANAYSPENKPTASDLEVLPLSGGNITGELTIKDKDVKTDDYHSGYGVHDLGDRVVCDIGYGNSKNEVFLVTLTYNHNPNGHSAYRSQFVWVVTLSHAYDGESIRDIIRADCLTPSNQHQGEAPKITWSDGTVKKDPNTFLAIHLTIKKVITSVTANEVNPIINVINLKKL